MVEGESLSLYFFINLLKTLKQKSKKLDFTLALIFAHVSLMKMDYFLEKFRLFIGGDIQNHWTMHLNSQRNCLD